MGARGANGEPPATAPKRVYLAGPPYANEYRRRAVAMLGAHAVDPMLRDFRGIEHGNEAAIVEGDVAELESCDSVLACFAYADPGTAMEAWHAYQREIPVVVYTAGTPPHPWVVYIAWRIYETLEDAVVASVSTSLPRPSSS